MPTIQQNTTTKSQKSTTNPTTNSLKPATNSPKLRTWTPKQVRFMNKYGTRNIGVTTEEICKELGISPVSVWKWMKNAKFCEEVNEISKKHVASMIPEVDQAAITKAVDGLDVPAMKLVYQRAQIDLKDDRPDTGNTTQVMINIGDDLADSIISGINRLRDIRAERKSGSGVGGGV